MKSVYPDELNENEPDEVPEKVSGTAPELAVVSKVV
jgi:hypothetical protein